MPTKIRTKKEQLKIAFKALLKQFCKDLETEYFVGDLVNSYTSLMLKEVSIRTNLREE